MMKKLSLSLFALLMLIIITDVSSADTISGTVTKDGSDSRNYYLPNGWFDQGSETLYPLTTDVNITGWVDFSSATESPATMVFFLYQNFYTSPYVYFSSISGSPNTYRIGMNDYYPGGGEWVNGSEYLVNGQALDSPINFAMTIGATNFTVELPDLGLSKSFDPTIGTWNPGSIGNGFAAGANLTAWGWDANNVSYFATTAGTGNAVPEPTTVLLFGVGLLGLAGVSRRKK